MAFDMNMESALAPTTEKSHHLLYLRDFRTQQCPLFLQHKCTQHRPYTCFHWHFQNQKRRRVIRREDGTFNYSATEYCVKYNEATGVCPDGEDCVALHKPANDVERKYHLRFYKTSTCIYETDAKGHCIRNGSHCPYAHGASDLRQAVLDVRELNSFRTRQPSLSAGLPFQTSDQPPADQLNAPTAPTLRCIDVLEREMGLSVIDPVWNDIVYVLLNYKTETCAKPPRLCRQGYACPYSHNQKDRRRPPLTFRYRSTPCPNVKHGDEWGDPGLCRQEDACQYCHTRTEQQFHHEIFKSTKCNDMLQTGFCPRGPFCAFAHVPEEITIARTGLMNLFSSSNLAHYIKNPTQTANLMGTLDHSAGPGPAPSTPTSSPNTAGYPPSSVAATTTQKRDTNNNHSASTSCPQTPQTLAAVNHPFGQSPGVSDAPLNGASFDPQHYAPAGNVPPSMWQLGRSRLNSITEEQLYLCSNLIGSSSLQSNVPDALASVDPSACVNPNAALATLLHSFPPSSRAAPHERFHSASDRPPNSAFELAWPDDSRNPQLGHFDFDLDARQPGSSHESGFASNGTSSFTHLHHHSQIDANSANSAHHPDPYGGALAQQYAAALRTRHFSGPAYVRHFSNGHPAPSGVPPSAFAPSYTPRSDNACGVTLMERRGSSEQEALASAGDTVESVIGSALEDPSDFRFGELSISDCPDGVDCAQTRSMFPTQVAPLSDTLGPNSERRGSAFDYDLQIPSFIGQSQSAAFSEASLAKHAACGREAYSEYDDTQADYRRGSDDRAQAECPGYDGTQHLPTGDLLRLQDQRIFATHEADEVCSRVCEWS